MKLLCQFQGSHAGETRQPIIREHNVGTEFIEGRRELVLALDALRRESNACLLYGMLGQVGIGGRILQYQNANFRARTVLFHGRFHLGYAGVFGEWFTSSQ